jgi:hypothetical protein
MYNFLKGIIVITITTNISLPAFARCAVCYTKGLSGASIAVIVIIFSATILFLANKLLQKFLDKNKI